jgi:hypothetical protein
MAEDLLLAFVRTAEVLRGDAGLGEDEFWGAWLPAVRVAAAEAHGKAALDVQLRIQDARQRYMALASSRPEGVPSRPVLGPPDEIRAGVSYYEDYLEIAEEVRCPACGGPAEVQMVARAEDIGDDLARFSAEGLFCNCCMLALSGQAEITAAGLRAALEVPLIDDPEMETDFPGLDARRAHFESRMFAAEARQYARNRPRYARLMREQRRYEEQAAQAAAEAELGKSGWEP